MQIVKDQQFFFGCKIDSKMREALSQARPGDRKYFEGESTEFLCICTAGDERWIGKILKGGMNVGEVEDIQRNIVSILRRISPTIRTSVSSIKMYAAEEGGGPADLPDEEPAVEGDAASADPSGGGGPYIDY
jgi:hypothetical protein